ncbi:MAG: AMP-binding protein [Spirochaetales bacterium]|jgi:hypothetical protein|nr:AMP-binding protein [Spirochaetales bacterium]
MLITGILEKNAAGYGKEIALIEREPAKNIRRHITWDGFNSQANSIANSLIAMGIKKEDKVIQLMMNCIEWLLVPWAHDILVAIENKDINLSDYKLDQWRLMHIGAQPVPPSLIKKWKKVRLYFLIILTIIFDRRCFSRLFANTSR